LIFCIGTCSLIVTNTADAQVAFGPSTSSTLTIQAIPCGIECEFQTGDSTGTAFVLSGTATGTGYSIVFPTQLEFAADTLAGSDVLYDLGGAAGDYASVAGLCYSGGPEVCGPPQYYAIHLGNQLTNNLLTMIWDVNGINLGFSFNVDPAFITDLVPASGGTPVLDVNYVDLTVAGVCYDLASPSGCPASSSPPPTVPEPPTLECLAIAGLGLVLARRRRPMHAHRQAS
jgi:hypothetical protein